MGEQDTTTSLHDPGPEGTSDEAPLQMEPKEVIGMMKVAQERREHHEKAMADVSERQEKGKSYLERAEMEHLQHDTAMADQMETDLYAYRKKFQTLVQDVERQVDVSFGELHRDMMEQATKSLSWCMTDKKFREFMQSMKEIYSLEAARKKKIAAQYADEVHSNFHGRVQHMLDKSRREGYRQRHFMEQQFDKELEVCRNSSRIELQSTLRQQSAELHTQFRRKMQAIEAAHARKLSEMEDTCLTKITEKDTEMAKLAADHSEVIERVRSEAEDLKKERISLQSDLKSTSEDLNRVTMMKERVEEANMRLEGQVNELETKCKDFEHTALKLKSRLELTEEMVEQVKIERDEFRKKVTDLRILNVVAKLSPKIQQKALKAEKVQVETLSAERDQLKRKNGTLETRISNFEAEVAELSDRVKTSTAQYNKEKMFRMTTLAQMTKEQKALQTKVTELENKNMELESKIQLNAAINFDGEETSAKQIALEAEILRLKEEIDELLPFKSQSEALKSLNEELIDKATKAEDRMKRMLQKRLDQEDAEANRAELEEARLIELEDKLIEEGIKLREAQEEFEEEKQKLQKEINALKEAKMEGDKAAVELEKFKGPAVEFASTGTDPDYSAGVSEAGTLTEINSNTLDFLQSPGPAETTIRGKRLSGVGVKRKMRSKRSSELIGTIHAPNVSRESPQNEFSTPEMVLAGAMPRHAKLFGAIDGNVLSHPAQAGSDIGSPCASSIGYRSPGMTPAPNLGGGALFIPQSEMDQNEIPFSPISPSSRRGNTHADDPNNEFLEYSSSSRSFVETTEAETQTLMRASDLDRVAQLSEKEDRLMGDLLDKDRELKMLKARMQQEEIERADTANAMQEEIAYLSESIQRLKSGHRTEIHQLEKMHEAKVDLIQRNVESWRQKYTDLQFKLSEEPISQLQHAKRGYPLDVGWYVCVVCARSQGIDVSAVDRVFLADEQTSPKNTSRALSRTVSRSGRGTRSGRVSPKSACSPKAVSPVVSVREMSRLNSSSSDILNGGLELTGEVNVTLEEPVMKLVDVDPTPPVQGLRRPQSSASTRPSPMSEVARRPATATISSNRTVSLDGWNDDDDFNLQIRQLQATSEASNDIDEELRRIQRGYNGETEKPRHGRRKSTPALLNTTSTTQTTKRTRVALVPVSSQNKQRSKSAHPRHVGRLRRPRENQRPFVGQVASKIGGVQTSFPLRYWHPGGEGVMPTAVLEAKLGSESPLFTRKEELRLDGALTPVYQRPMSAMPTRPHTALA
eukprot:Rmarinus@m.4604